MLQGQVVGHKGLSPAAEHHKAAHRAASLFSLAYKNFFSFFVVKAKVICNDIALQDAAPHHTKTKGA